jgi:hypothetical protein
MFRTSAAFVAVSVLAIGAPAATEASAIVKDPSSVPTTAVAQPGAYDWPDEGSGYPGSSTKSPEYNYPNYDPGYEVPRSPIATVTGGSSDTGVEIAQAGVSAASGAAIALGAMWLYRRRHAPAT